MRVLKISLVFMGSVLLIAALILTVLFTVDLGRAKGTIVNFASEYLERELTLDALSIDLGRQVQVTASGLALASTDWTEQPLLLAVDDLAVTVDLLAALEGTVIVEDFSASGVRGHLSVNADGTDNWTLAPFEIEDEEPAMPVILRKALISDFELSYLDPELPAVRLAASRIEADEREDGDLSFAITGALNDTPLTASGSAGTLDDIIEATNVRFAVDADIGEIEIESSGLIDDLAEPRRPQLVFAVRGPNAEYLTSVLDIEPVTSGPLDIKGHIDGAAEQLEVRLDGTFGEFDIDLTAALADLQNTDDLNLVLRTSGPSMATVARLAGQEDFPALPFSVDAALARSGDAITVERVLVDIGPARLSASASIPEFPGLAGAQVKLTAEGPEFGDLNRLLGLPGKLTGPFEISADLAQQDDGASTLTASLTARDIRAQVSGNLTTHPELAGSVIDVAASGANLSVLTVALGYEGVPAEPFGIEAGITVIEDAARISDGSATLGAERLDFDGVVGIDPFSPLTRLRFGTRIDDLGELLSKLEVEVENLPAGALELNGQIAREDGAFLIDDFVATLAATEARVEGRVGDSFALADINLTVDVTGESLAAIAPIDTNMVADTPFRVAGRIGFMGEDTLLLEGIDASFDDATVKLELSASLTAPQESGAFEIDAAGPSLAALVPGAAEYLPEANAFSARGAGRWQATGLELDPTVIEVGPATVNVQGRLRPPPNLADSAMTLSTSLPSLEMLQFLTETPLPDEPFSARAVVSGTQTELNLTELVVALGKSDLTGTASFRPPANPEDIPAFSAVIRSDYLDLRAFQPAADEDSVAATEQADDGRLIPDTPIPLEDLKQINGSFDIAAREVLLRTTRVHDVGLLGNLTDGALRIERFALTGGLGGELSGQLSLLPEDAEQPRSAALALHLEGTNLLVGLPAATEEDQQLLPTYEVRSELAASGSTVRELAATATGYLRLVGSEGKLDISAIGFLAGDFSSQVLNAVNPLAKKERLSSVQCFAVLIEATDDQIVGQPAIIFQSDKLNITGVSKVDLRTEKLKARFSTQARKGIGIGMSDLVSPLTEVGGTLASPTMQLNAKGALIEGGTAVATMGISFLAKKARDRLFSGANPCQKAIDAADADLASKKAEPEQ